MLSQGGQQYNAMIGDDENSGFMGFGLLGLWVFDIYILLFLLVFLVLLRMGFLVFDFRLRFDSKFSGNFIYFFSEICYG